MEDFLTDDIIAGSAPTLALRLDFPEESITDQHPHHFPLRSHYQILPIYAPTEVPLTDMKVPVESSIISIGTEGRKGGSKSATPPPQKKGKRPKTREKGDCREGEKKKRSRR